jgi:hypothetical protein
VFRYVLAVVYIVWCMVTMTWQQHGISRERESMSLNGPMQGRISGDAFVDIGSDGDEQCDPCSLGKAISISLAQFPQ